MNRRKFLYSASLIAVASLTDTFALHVKKTNLKKLIPIIDTHQHLWDIERFKNGWSKPPLPRNFNMQDYLEAIKGLNVIKSVYMEVAVPPDKRHEEALYAIEICKDKRNPTVAAVIAVDPNRSDFKEYMSEFLGSPYIKGIRYFFKSGEEIVDDQVVKNIRLLGEMGMSFDLVVPPKWLPHGIRLVRYCPGTRFIVDHCGNADPKAFFKPGKSLPKEPEHDAGTWKRDMKTIASEKNVVCKISGIVSRVPGYPLTEEDLAPIINHCLYIFGNERVMFAGDWPVCLKNMPLADWVNTLKKVVENRPLKDQKKLFHDNAAKFYGL
jgi:predicted TIM-barrel fold metal-dependent hydrolase